MCHNISSKVARLGYIHRMLAEKVTLLNIV